MKVQWKWSRMLQRRSPRSNLLTKITRLLDNEQAYRRYKIRPRILVDVRRGAKLSTFSAYVNWNIDANLTSFNVLLEVGSGASRIGENSYAVAVLVLVDERNRIIETLGL